MLHVGSPPAAYQGSHFSRMPPILRWTPAPFAQQYHWLFAQPTLRPSPPHCLHPLPMPCQNDSASQKLVLKEDHVLLHIPHLLVEVGGDVQTKKPVHPRHPCKTMRPIASPSKHTLPPPHTLTHTSARVEDAFHKEVASTEMTTMATPLGGVFPITRAIDIAFCTIDCKGTWAAALLRPVVDFTMVVWGK